MTERIIHNPDSWWTNLVNINVQEPELKEKLLSLRVMREGRTLTAEIDGQRRPVDFSSVSFTTVVVYETGKDQGVPVFKCLTFPNLPWIQITRNGAPNKHSWTIEEQES